MENVALESTRTMEFDEFVDRDEIDPLADPPLLPAAGRQGAFTGMQAEETKKLSSRQQRKSA